MGRLLFWNKGCNRKLCYRNPTKQLVIGYGTGFESKTDYCEYHHKIVCEVLADISKEQLFGVPIKTADWVKGNDMVMYLNGVEEIVHLDGTDKTVRKTIKEPQMVVYHAGETRSLKDLRANTKSKSELAH